MSVGMHRYWSNKSVSGKNKQWTITLNVKVAPEDYIAMFAAMSWLSAVVICWTNSKLLIGMNNLHTKIFKCTVQV